MAALGPGIGVTGMARVVCGSAEPTVIDARLYKDGSRITHNWRSSVTHERYRLS